uniref:Uncharacterized protein n=1 Tax=Pristionchus pacificus TaxID=54126 RepID=A0A2A6B407_PRIPA|eukprot:PDM60612.1 hypothetical protein PRIPAC_53590 [Pristionchus pacificus]
MVNCMRNGDETRYVVYFVKCVLTKLGDTEESKTEVDLSGAQDGIRVSEGKGSFLQYIVYNLTLIGYEEGN